MAENEKTSHRIASLASKLMKMENPRIVTDQLWEEIKEVAASALTQTPDHSSEYSVEMYKKMKKNNYIPIDFSKLYNES